MPEVCCGPGVRARPKLRWNLTDLAKFVAGGSPTGRTAIDLYYVLGCPWRPPPDLAEAVAREIGRLHRSA